MTRLREVSLFCWSVEQNARDTQMTTRVTEGARREISSRASAPVSRVSCNPVTKSEEKGRLLAFYWWPAMSTIGESQAISHSNDTGQQAQQVVGNSIFNRNFSGEGQLKFFANGEDDDNKKPRAKHGEHCSVQWRQRRQHSDHKHVQRQPQNTTITLQMEPRKPRREHRLPTLQKVMGRSGNAYSLQ